MREEQGVREHEDGAGAPEEVPRNDGGECVREGVQRAGEREEGGGEAEDGEAAAAVGDRDEPGGELAAGEGGEGGAGGEEVRSGVGDVGRVLEESVAKSDARFDEMLLEVGSAKHA